jgi:hypothetical protein
VSFRSFRLWGRSGIPIIPAFHLSQLSGCSSFLVVLAFWLFQHYGSFSFLVVLAILWPEKKLRKGKRTEHFLRMAYCKEIAYKVLL